MPAPWVIPAITTGIGALGTLFGGGKDATQTTTTNRALSPMQAALLKQLQGQFGQDAFDIEGILGATRERFGAEASGLRQAALQRMLRSGQSPLQTEMLLSDISTPVLREMGSTLADIEFTGQKLEEERRLQILRQMAGLLEGTGTTTSTTTGRPQSGQGFAQLFGAGLSGLMGAFGGGGGGGGNNPNFYMSPFGR